MARRQNPEVITRNEEYCTGYIAGAAGIEITKNPYVVDSFEWLSWIYGWQAGRFHYMDEGWSFS